MKIRRLGGCEDLISKQLGMMLIATGNRNNIETYSYTVYLTVPTETIEQQCLM